jgi:hypothetical protein
VAANWPLDYLIFFGSPLSSAFPKNFNIFTTEDISEEREVKGDAKSFWNHITISRDQTTSSDFKKDLLIILRGRLHISATSIPGAADSNFEAPKFHKPPFARREVMGEPSNPDSARTLAEVLRDAAGSYLEPSSDKPQSTAELTNIKPAEHTINPVINFMANDNTAVPRESSNMNELLGRISCLETENRNLRQCQEVQVRSKTLFFIGNDSKQPATAYLDEPTWAIGPRGKIVLKANFPIPDVEGYIEQQHEVAFIIAKFYTPTEQQSEVQSALREKRKLPIPVSSSETIRLESQNMIEAMESYIRGKPKFNDDFPDFDVRSPLLAPYLFWYHDRSPDSFENLSELHRKYMLKLTGWINENYGDMYRRVVDQLERKVVSYESVAFLIKSGDVIIVNSTPGQEGGQLKAKVATSWPSSRTAQRAVDSGSGQIWRNNPNDKENKYIWKWGVSCWAYKYDGSFYRHPENIEIKIEAQTLEQETDIRKLNAFPLRYATEETRDLLQKRARTIWSCRYQRLVSYEDKSGTYGVRC